MGPMGRMGRTRRGTALAGGLLLAAAAAACSSPTEGRDTEAGTVRADALEARLQDGIHLLTQAEDLEAYPAALYEGTVVADERGCVRLGSQGASTVIWPAGFTAATSGGRVVIRDGSGAAVGPLGDAFRMGGGHVPTLHEGLGFTEDDHRLAVSRCPGDFWIAGPGSVEGTE